MPINTIREYVRRRRSFVRDYFAICRLRKVRRVVTRLGDLDGTKRERSESFSQVKHRTKSAHPAGTLVICKYCFRNLGRESVKKVREVLLAKHECFEAQWARQPAAPPPYN
jgi:hypothetical protein